MFELCPLCLSGGPRSDRHGVIERHPTLALSGPFLDPGDIASHGAVEEYGPQIPTLGQRRTEVQRPRPAEQTGPLRRQAVAYAASGSGKVAQAEANRQAIVRRPSRPSRSKLGVEPLEFDAGVGGCELPIGFGVMLVSMGLPGCDLAFEG